MLREVARVDDGAEAVRGERRRILATILEQLDDLVQDAVQLDAAAR